MTKLGIIGAMQVEVEILLGAMENKKVTQKAGTTFCEGRLEDLDVVVVQCGVGKVNAAICAQILCDLFNVTHIVNTGIAGSLFGELDIGDFVVSRDAIYHDFTCQGLNPAYEVGQIPDMGHGKSAGVGGQHSRGKDTGLLTAGGENGQCHGHGALAQTGNVLDG